MNARRVDGSLRILAVIATPSRIHHEWIRTLIVALSERGHRVTMLSAVREEKRRENVKTIWIENLQGDVPARRNLDDSTTGFTLWEIVKIYNLGVKMCEKAMRSRGVEKLMKSRDNFDLILMDVAGSQAFYGFVKHFGNPPVVGFSAFGIPPWVPEMLGAGAEPSQVPHASVPYTNRMSYPERFWNNLLFLFTRFYRQRWTMPRMRAIIERYFDDGEDPSVTERNFAILLANADPTIDYPQSLPPTLVTVAGLHLVEANYTCLAISDLQNFVDNSSHGVVYISLGDAIRLDDVEPRKLKSLLGALSRLEEDVLWHLPQQELPEMPRNVKIFQHVPHNDVLGHPKIRVFLTPGGGLSLQDAIYHGVPLACLPFTSNDRFSARRSISLGTGVILDYSNFTEETIFTCLRRVLDDSSYAENAKKLSRLFRDQPTTPLERAIFWTEYAARTSGARHLRLPALEMTWFQRSMTDVVLGYFFVLLFLYTCIKIFLRHLFAHKVDT